MWNSEIFSILWRVIGNMHWVEEARRLDNSVVSTVLLGSRYHLTTKRASGSCLLERETLLGKAGSAPVRVCSAKQRLPVSPLGLCSPFGLGGSGLPHAPCA